jgi:hypothetical protein
MAFFLQNPKMSTHKKICQSYRKAGKLWAIDLPKLYQSASTKVMGTL